MIGNWYEYEIGGETVKWSLITYFFFISITNKMQNRQSEKVSRPEHVFNL